MRWILPTCVVLILTFSSVVQSQVQDLPNIKRLASGSERPAARASDLDWLAGQWRGEGLGGQCEESWLPAVGGTLIGSFRLADDGEPVFYEFMAITEDAGSLTFRVKHFNPDMTGWEEKDETMDFLLVEVGENEAYFDGLTLRRTGSKLEIFLSMKGKDGTVREEAFVFERVP